VNRREGGFSLIELLVAATILFMALAVATESWLSFLLAAEKSGERVALAPAALALPSHVDERLKNAQRDRFEEAGTLLGVAYRVEARRLRSVSGQQAAGGSESDELPNTTASLWEVDVVLSKEGSAFSKRYLTLLP
jgi:type II secretory pathway pseudopilin PulG